MMAAGATEHRIRIRALACDDAACCFRPREMVRRSPGDFDVRFQIVYCGVCHTDLHTAANHLSFFGNTLYPCVPGHELAGVVSEIGKRVTRFAVGDHIGVGNVVDSCNECEKCAANSEHQCAQSVLTYGTPNGKSGKVLETKFPTVTVLGKHVFPDAGQPATIGGMSSEFVVGEDYGVKLPKSLPLANAGPLMCSGITMWEPMKKFFEKWRTQKKVEGADEQEVFKIGIAGLGGLGVIGLQLASQALGKKEGVRVKVFAISRGVGKKDLAMANGADVFVDYSDAGSETSEYQSKMRDVVGDGLDLILDTLPVAHELTAFRSLLLPKTGNVVLLGLSKTTYGAFFASHYLPQKKGVTDTIHTSLIGSMQNLREVVELCAQLNLTPGVVEVRPAADVAEIYELLDSGNDAGKRYVLDMDAFGRGGGGGAEDGVPAKIPKLQAHTPVTTLQVVQEGVKLYLDGTRLGKLLFGRGGLNCPQRRR